MGRTGYRIALSDLKGRFVGHREGVFRDINGNNERLEILKEAIFGVLEETRIGESDLLGIICIAPGMHVEKGKGLRWTPQTVETAGQDLGVFFRGLFEREVVMHHSTKLSLLGEKIAGRARGYENVVYVDFAYGLGCAIMIDGKIYFGSRASAGEIGYFYSSLDEFSGSSVRPYRLGCLESRISGKALQDRAAEISRRAPGGRIAELSKRESGQPSGKLVFEAHRLGDPEAGKVLKEAFAYFNMALSNIINLLAPELVILGGGFSRAGEILRDLVARELRDRVLTTPRIEVSELANEASLIGGIQYLIDHTDLLAEL
jgi:glucokinase